MSETKFKVGDRVRFTKGALQTSWGLKQTDEPMRVSGASGACSCGSYRLERNGIPVSHYYGDLFADKWLEPVPDPPTIDPSKTYRTRDGREVKIITTSGPDPDCPVVIHVPSAPHHRRYQVRAVDGTVATAPAGSIARAGDLIEVKPEHTLWMVVGKYSGYVTKSDALAAAVGIKGAAVIPVTFREGDGL